MSTWQAEIHLHFCLVVFSDGLFGTCQSRAAAKDWYQYQLSEKELQLLEAEVSRLVISGSSWNDLYTQCVLGNILLGFRTGSDVDPDFCDTGGRSRAAIQDADVSDALDQEALRLLGQYIKFEGPYRDPNAKTKGIFSDEEFSIPASNSQGSEDFLVGPYSKKDEIVQVHKYLKSHKRDPYQLNAGDFQLSPASLDYNSYFDDISSADLALLQQFLAGEEDEGEGEDEEDSVVPQGDLFDSSDYGGNEEIVDGDLDVSENGMITIDSLTVTYPCQWFIPDWKIPESMLSSEVLIM